MPKDLFYQHVEDMEMFCENAAAYTSMAERAIDHIKLEENGYSSDMPDRLKEYDEPREAVRDLMNKAFENFENAFVTFQKNTILQEANDQYSSSETLSNYIFELDCQDLEASIDSSRLLEELDFFEATLEYAERNDVNFREKLSKYTGSEDSQMLQKDDGILID